jgi:hypothetical protein
MSESKNRMKLPRLVDDREKSMLAPHVQQYANAQSATKESFANINELSEMFAGPCALNIDGEGEWQFVPKPPAGMPGMPGIPQIVPPEADPAQTDIEDTIVEATE